MLTPSGVNYLLQFLQYSYNSPIIGIQESKVEVQSYVLMFVLCYHTQFLCYFIGIFSWKPLSMLKSVGKYTQYS